MHDWNAWSADVVRRAQVTSAGIPRIVWQTWKTHARTVDDPTLTPMLRRCTTRMLEETTEQPGNAGWWRIVMDDDDMEGWMRACAPPQIYQAFTMLTTPVERTDLWRYTIIWYFGGVYCDMDIFVKQSFDTWEELHENRGPRLITGWFTDTHWWHFFASSPSEMTQWCFAATPRAPALHMVMRACAVQIAAGVTCTLHKTGPRVFTQAILQHLAGSDLGALQTEYNDTYHTAVNSALALSKGERAQVPKDGHWARVVRDLPEPKATEDAFWNDVTVLHPRRLGVHRHTRVSSNALIQHLGAGTWKTRPRVLPIVLAVLATILVAAVIGGVIAIARKRPQPVPGMAQRPNVPKFSLA